MAKAKSNTRTKITDATKDLVIEALAAGETRGDVAAAHGISVSAVDSIRKKAAGIKAEKSAARKAKKKSKTKAKILDDGHVVKGGLNMQVDGGYMVVRIPMKNLTASLIQGLRS